MDIDDPKFERRPYQPTDVSLPRHAETSAIPEATAATLGEVGLCGAAEDESGHVSDGVVRVDFPLT